MLQYHPPFEGLCFQVGSFLPLGTLAAKWWWKPPSYSVNFRGLVLGILWQFLA